MWGGAKGEKFSGLHSCWAEFAAIRYSLRTLTVQLKTISIYGVFMLVNFNLDITVHKMIFLQILQTVMDKTPTHALFTQHYISLAC